jgi:hypothetical protein
VSKMKNLSRAGWVTVGLVAAMLLVPTMAVAATVAYNGIEGTNGTTTTLNKADVTSAGQLLTTEASPRKYVDYQGTVNGAYSPSGNGCEGEGYCDCEPVGPSPSSPSGDALVIQAIYVDPTLVDQPFDEGDSGPDNTEITGTAAEFTLGLGNSSASCLQTGVPLVVSAAIPNGAVGGFSIPLSPGYVVPNGYTLDGIGVGFGGTIYVTGYLVPSADAPSTPQSIRSSTFKIPLCICHQASDSTQWGNFPRIMHTARSGSRAIATSVAAGLAQR